MGATQEDSEVRHPGARMTSGSFSCSFLFQSASALNTTKGLRTKDFFVAVSRYAPTGFARPGAASQKEKRSREGSACRTALAGVRLSVVSLPGSAVLSSWLVTTRVRWNVAAQLRPRIGGHDASIEFSITEQQSGWHKGR